MPRIGDFHNKPFDENTLTKLEIFELYAREWFAVFLAKDPPLWSKIHVYDFFSGPGTDSNSIPGSPLRILRQLSKFQTKPAWNKVGIHVHFYDESAQKISQLQKCIDSKIPLVSYDIKPLSFEIAWEKSLEELNDPHAAKLVFIDQTGVRQVTDDVFRKLIDSPTCDFLFFISSSILNRFRDHPAINQKIERPDDPYHVHRAALDYYKSLIPPRKEYFLAPFSIKKGPNIYGLIFGSAHPLGMDKFLEIAWKSDAISGQANFNIDRENVRPNQLSLPLPECQPSKILIFENELENQLRSGQLANELDVIKVCFNHGVRRKHAETVLTKLKMENVMDIGFRVPDIRKIKTPRPILLKT